MDDKEMMEGLYKQRETNDGEYIRAADYLGKSSIERAEALCKIKDSESGKEFYESLSSALLRIARYISR